MARFEMLASAAVLISCLDVVSSQPFQISGGERNVRITVDITDTPPPQPVATNMQPSSAAVKTVEVEPVVQVEASVEVEPAVQAAVEQPPLPSAHDSSSPKLLAGYFCRMWKDENYKAMYYCMSKRYRAQVELGKFVALFASDADKTGGLDAGIIVAEDPENAAGHLVLLDLKFLKKKVPARRVKALFEKTKDGYRLIKSGILPVDFNNL